MAKEDRLTRRSAPSPATRDASYLDLIIQTAPDAIITIDASGSVLSFSPSAQRMFGYDESEVVGKNVNILMPEPHRSRHDEYMSRYLRTGEKRVIGIGREVKARRKNGEIFTAELAVGELRKDNEAIFTGFIRDVSDRVQALRRVGRLQRALDQVSRIQTLGEMSTALAHEINQPLAAIANSATAARRTLEARPDDVAAATALLDDIAAEARRAGEIIRRMRRMVDRGRADLRPEDINEIVQEAVRLSQGVDNVDEAHVVLDLGRKLPRVRADRIQIQQVVVNLIRNALEAMTGESGHDLTVRTELEHPEAKVVVTADRNDHAVMVTVKDSGPGVPPDLIDRIFEPFTSSKESGLGVGLAVCRSIVEAHGGRIWAENNPRRGASFHFTLPTVDE